MKNWHKLTLIVALLIAVLCVFRSELPVKSGTDAQRGITARGLDSFPKLKSTVNQRVVAHALGPDEDYEPPLSQKTLDIINRAIREKWPSIQIRALIAMTRDPRLIAELWRREPVDVNDLSTLTLYSSTQEERLAAAELWAKADPGNAEPQYTLFLNKFIKDKNIKNLLPELDGILALPRSDSYLNELSLAYDVVQKHCGLENEIGIFGMQGGYTAQSSGRKILNVLSEYVKSNGISVDEKVEIAGLAAGLTRQVLNKKSLSSTEYSDALAGELGCLSQIDGQIDYGEEGVTVEDRRNELSRLFDEEREMTRICQEEFRVNKDLFIIFNQRKQSVGEYEAYRQLYNSIKQNSTTSVHPEAIKEK